MYKLMSCCVFVMIVCLFFVGSLSFAQGLDSRPSGWDKGEKKGHEHKDKLDSMTGEGEAAKEEAKVKAEEAKKEAKAKAEKAKEEAKAKAEREARVEKAEREVMAEKTEKKAKTRTEKAKREAMKEKRQKRFWEFWK